MLGLLAAIGTATASCSSDKEPAPKRTASPAPARTHEDPEPEAHRPSVEADMPTVKELIAEQLDVPPGRVVPDAKLVDDLGADSLAVVEVILAFEEKFDVRIPDEALSCGVTVGDLVQRLDTLRGAHSPAKE